MGLRNKLRLHADIEPLLIVVAVFLGYTSLCFGIVALDPDNGRDFVAADLLLHGKILYRDIAYYFGPLAPWVNSSLFRLFSPSVGVLLLTGAVVSLAVVMVAYLLARQFLSPGVAALGAVLVVAYAVYGYNMFCYAVPYTFAATYGLLFSLLTLYCALRATERWFSRWDILSGAAAALALACKQEFAFTSLLILLTGFALRLHKARRRLFRAIVVCFIVYGAIGGAFAIALFNTISLGEFVRNVFPAQAPAWRHFYENAQYWGPNAWTGIRESVTGLLSNLAFIIWATCFAALISALASGGRRAKRLFWVLIVAGPLVIWKASYLWYYPLLLHGIVLTFTVVGRIRGSRLKLALLTISAGLFLMRVLPHPATKGYYGLLYFIPSLLVYLYLCFELVIPQLARGLQRLTAGMPQVPRKQCGSAAPQATESEQPFPEGRLRGAMAAVFVVCFVVPHFFVVNGWARRAEPIVTERGKFRVEREEAAKAKVVLEEIRRHSLPGDKILMLPHACMYYFVSGRQQASRYLAYTYGQVLDGGPEREEIARLSQAPPKLIVIDDFHHRLHIPGPVDTFGTAYNVELHHWIRKHYREVRTIPYQDRDVHFLIPKNNSREVTEERKGDFHESGKGA